MIAQITEGVKVSVETFYQSDYSNPLNGEFIFAYRITIENCNAFTVKLLRRHFYIHESDNSRREIEGEGVVGQIPVIRSDEGYQYVSGCNMHTELGRMHGEYLMENTATGRQFTVFIPAFQLVPPFKLN